MADPPKVGWFRFIFIVYFCVSGGPYGIEGVIGGAGPLLGLLMLLFIPLVWNIPVTIMTVELTKACPECELPVKRLRSLFVRLRSFFFFLFLSV